MKKKLAIILAVVLLVLTFCGCSQKYNKVETDEIINSMVYGDTYVVVLEIKQKHYLDIGAMIKDEFNALEIPIPVSEEFYNYVEAGDILDDSFRMGSFVMSGSFGTWKISIKDKYVR